MKQIKHQGTSGWLAVCVCFITIQGLLAQVQFEAKVSRQTLGLNERLRVDFSMNEDGDNFTPPSFEGFRLVGGPNQSVSFSWMNGKKAFNKTYSYYLLPQQRGSITIRQASIEINGQIYKTSPININVTAATEQLKDPNNVEQTTSNGIHLVAEVSKANPYINEPITVVYKLYVSPRVSVRNWRELDNPKYTDFWSQNIDIKDMNVEQGKFNGEDYRFVVLRKTVLYPQKSGKLVIEPLTLDIVVDVPSNRRDIFGGMIMSTDNKTVSAGSRVINAKPLPEQGKPTGFTGAVGRFDFKVKPSKTELSHGESLDLEVVISGQGNLKLFTLPKPLVPSALEMYDPVHTENISTGLTGIRGTVSDKYTIIPQYQGNYPIQPLVFSYFDLGTNSYKVVTSDELIIKVEGGPTTADSQQIASNGGVAKVAVSKTNQFKYIKSDTQLSEASADNFFGSGLHIGLLLLPFGIIPMLILFKRKKQASDNDIIGNRLKASNKLAKKYLSEAKQQLANKELFYIALERALHNFLKAKLHIETSEMQKNTIKELLTDKKVSSDTVSQFIELIQNCEFARYAPTSNTIIEQDFDKAVRLLSELEKQI